MLKKWIYIFTLFCLANSLIAFYSGDTSTDPSGQPQVADIDSRAGSSTLLDLLIGQIQNNDEGEDGKAPFKRVFRHTYSIVRSFAFNVQIPFQSVFSFFRIPGIVHHVYGNHLIRKPILPSYYNFLFRLSPF
ncbi:MAG: hypothetical protein JST68_07180 [Bacteroidetes bacterium]|nr:hypothetical protein [Bacteroidota bacterium]